MASLQAVRSGGRLYWRIVESRRVNGKPRPVPVCYLGTAEALLDRLRGTDRDARRIQSFSHGDVAALKAAADRLGVVGIIDRHVKKRGRRLGVGTTLLLAALNRAVRPRSKRGWRPWAEQTSMARLFPSLDIRQLTSQYFWDQMHCVPIETLKLIEADLTKKIVEELKIDLDAVFYDTTNFFTYIASTNKRPKLPQRGHSKQHRADLRLFSLSLLVSRDGHIPLCSHLYEGNKVDATVFPESLTAIRERLERLALTLKDVTLVYDKGNNSARNQALVDQGPFGYVASLVPSHHPALLAIPMSEYREIPDGPLKGLRVLRRRENVWEAERTVVLLVSEQLRAGQIRGLEQHLSKRLRQLEAWKSHLEKPRSGSRWPLAAAKKKIDGILAGPHIKKILRVAYDPTKSGSARLTFSVDLEARARIDSEIFGKRILVTNRDGWSDEEIVTAYRGQHRVEEAFRQVKDDEHLAIRPQYHWTDQKIHVHTFICLLALLLARVVERTAREAGSKESLSGILDRLGRIRLAMILQQTSAKGGRPRCDWQLEETEKGLLDLFLRLVPHRPPFVYTPTGA
jgi:transposase